MNLDSARQSTIEACGPNDEAIVKTMAAETREGLVDLRSAEQVNEANGEDRLGKAAASPNSQNLTERGIFAKHTTHSPEETHRLGKAFGQSLTSGSIIAFFGDLGAGKTTFIRGLVDGIGSVDMRNVCSPTFTLLNIYNGDKMVFHFDLYRLPREEEFFAAGFDEYFKAGGICCLEWAEKITSSLPTHTFKVIFSHLGEKTRQIEILK